MARAGKSSGTHSSLPYQLSAELFTVPLEEGNYLIYAPLRRAAFIGNAATVNFLASLRGDAVDQVETIELSGAVDEPLVAFLRQLNIIDSDHPEQAPEESFSGTPRPTGVTLFMTTGCNLRCTYCYASAGDTPLKSMPLETAVRGIDFVANNAAKTEERHFSVSYHGGGEPTANWHVLTDSFDYAYERCKLHGLTFTAAAATNGVLRQEQIEWVVHNLNGGVSVSFDGIPEVHDRNRLTISGTGSSHRVIHTLREFDRLNYDYGIRVTVTHDMIDRLVESIDFICSDFSPQRILVEPAYQLGRWSESPSAETESFIDAFREAQACAWSHSQTITYSALRVDTLTSHFCGISQDSFALTPDGNVSACYEAFTEDNPFRDVFFYGRPDETSAGYQFDLPVLNNLRNQRVDDRTFCEGCFAKWHCSGDCYHKALATNGRGEFSGTERCHITRELTKDEILNRILESGGVFWHEPTEELISED